MVYVLSLLAACGIALGSVLQQKGTLEAPAGEDDPRFLAQILRRPVWLAGGACQAAGWVFQAAALDRGSLLIVQSLTTMSLVIALPLGARITDQQITRRVIWGALAVVAGVTLFLAVGSPQGGTSTTTSAAWWSACLSSAVLIGALFVLGRHRSGPARALIFGAAAGVAFGLQAAVMKVFVTLVGHGVAGLLSSWSTYVLIGSALIGFALQQAALKTGVLAPALGSSNAITLFVAVLLGVNVFGERLASGHGELAAAVIGLSVALVGVALLSAAPTPKDIRASDHGESGRDAVRGDAW
jgi:drug/metabolite transporter (DMT)-like permease